MSFYFRVCVTILTRQRAAPPLGLSFIFFSFLRGIGLLSGTLKRSVAPRNAAKTTLYEAAAIDTVLVYRPCAAIHDVICAAHCRSSRRLYSKAIPTVVSVREMA